MATTIENKAPTPQETGRNGTLIDFIEADYAAKTDCLTKQDNARARIVDSFKPRDVERNAAIEKSIDQIARDTAVTREALQKGAREAFTKGRHDKIQVLVAEPEKFLPVGFRRRLQTDISLIAKTLIQLMDAAENPTSAIPERALDKITSEDRKQVILNHALYMVVTDYTKIEKVEKAAYALIELGARPNDMVLANAVHAQVSPALIALMIENGANVSNAFKLLNSNRGRYGYSSERLRDVLNFLAVQDENKKLKAQLAELQQNKHDVTAKTTKPVPPGAGPAAKPNKHVL